MDIVEIRNRIMFLNFDQIDSYPTFENGGETYVDAGTVLLDVLETGWEIISLTETSAPEIDAILVFEGSTPKTVNGVVLSEAKGRFGIRLGTLSEDAQYAFAVTAVLEKASTGETSTLEFDSRVILLSGYITCPNENLLPIWAIDFNPDGMEGEVINDDAITVSITDILLTPYNTRPHRPDYGTPLASILFSTITQFMGEELLDEVISQLNRWEKRIIVDENRAGLELFPSRHMMMISIPYYVPSQRRRVLYRKLLQE